MLKVKEGIELDELEKYGFERRCLGDLGDAWCYWKECKEEYYKTDLIVWEDNRKVCNSTTNLPNALYDLITASIVVKE